MTIRGIISIVIIVCPNIVFSGDCFILQFFVQEEELVKWFLPDAYQKTCTQVHMGGITMLQSRKNYMNLTGSPVDYLGAQNVTCRGKKCYSLSSRPLLLDEAQQSCLSRNGTLATIDSEELQQQLDEKFIGRHYWIGLSLTSAGFEWTDRQPLVNYRNFNKMKFSDHACLVNRRSLFACDNRNPGVVCKTSDSCDIENCTESNISSCVLNLSKSASYEESIIMCKDAGGPFLPHDLPKVKFDSLIEGLREAAQGRLLDFWNGGILNASGRFQPSCGLKLNWQPWLRACVTHDTRPWRPPGWRVRSCYVKSLFLCQFDI